MSRRLLRTSSVFHALFSTKPIMQRHPATMLRPLVANTRFSVVQLYASLTMCCITCGLLFPMENHQLYLSGGNNVAIVWTAWPVRARDTMDRITSMIEVMRIVYLRTIDAVMGILMFRRWCVWEKSVLVRGGNDFIFFAE